MDVGIYDYGWSHRCDVCDLACSSKRGVAIHKSRAHKNGKTQNFLGTLADKTVMTCKIIEQQKERPKIKCGGRELDNVFRSKYLGSVFTADADQDHDINARIAQAYTRCGKLRQVLDSLDLSVNIKLRLYQAAVCSIMMYGCETWSLTPAVMRKLNGANSKMLARFTGKTIPQEARSVTCSFDLLHSIHVRRFKWIGHILRAGPSRLIYQAVEEQHRIALPDNILMDAPPHSSLMGLTIQVRDRQTWRSMSRKI